MPDGTAVAALLGAAGFTSVALERHTLPVIFEGGPDQLMSTFAVAAVATQVAALPPAGRDELARAVAAAAAPITEAGAVVSTMATHLVVATA